MEKDRIHTKINAQTIMKKLILIFTICLISFQAWSQTPTFSFPLNEANAIWGPGATSGSLVVDSTYKIGLFESGDNFTNVGGTNESGDIFTATGTTPTTWTNGSLLSLQNYATLETEHGSLGIIKDCFNVQDHKGSGFRWYETDGMSTYIDTNYD